MKSKLDILLESISPESTIQQTYNLANEAIMNFRCDKATVASWEEFKCCMARFLKHLDGTVLKLKKIPDIDLTEYWRYCIKPLLKTYGSSGDVTAFMIASTGNEGGLYAVLKAFAMYKAEEYTKNEISSKISVFWQGLSTDEKLKAADEYLCKYKQIIPSEMLEDYDPLIKGYFWKILEKHPFMIHKLRQTGR